MSNNVITILPDSNKVDDKDGFNEKPSDSLIDVKSIDGGTTITEVAKVNPPTALNLFSGNQEYSLDSQKFFEGGFKSIESWDSVERFQSRIIEISEDSITCECVIDKENLEFEEREFRRNLFKHLPNIELYMSILLIFKEKAGSARVDVYDGKGLVDIGLFEFNDFYQELENSPLTKPFKNS